VNKLFALVTEKDIVATSFRIALFVGSILALINYGDRVFFSYDMRAIDWIKLIITYFVPYCVATYGAVRYAMRHVKGKEYETTNESTDL
jgi:hypothetical protein